MGDWPSSMPSFALTNITEAYLNDEDLKAAAICNFRSNRRRMGFDSFLRSFPTASGWFALWENCDHSGQKHLRQFYRRPSFLPLAVELTRPNWVIASQGFSGRRFKQLEFESGSTLVWLAQVKGLGYIRLTPEAVCSDICQELELLLEARDIRVGTDGAVVVALAATWLYLAGHAVLAAVLWHVVITRCSDEKLSRRPEMLSVASQNTSIFGDNWV
ncbi:uncharacterized protein [Dermacentor albipictus]|uniref:uncharacterized protein n=1 Tax=Dermacentor albipictus TaxID=60249 RepID=UPI0038FC3D86